MVLDKVKTDGLMPTLEAVRNKLDQPLPMGYCNAGVVMEVGAGVHRVFGGRPGGVEREARGSGMRAGEPVREGAGDCERRGGGVHGDRCHRTAGHSARRSRRSAKRLS